MKKATPIVLIAGLTALNLIVKEPLLLAVSAVVAVILVIVAFRDLGKKKGKC